MTFYDLPHHYPAPKRGDLMQTNIGDLRERTWFILKVREVKRRWDGSQRRYELWMVRWWEIEPEMRLSLFKSAERHGGQKVHLFYRYPARKKKSFEDCMRWRSEK